MVKNAFGPLEGNVWAANGLRIQPWLKLPPAVREKASAPVRAMRAALIWRRTLFDTTPAGRAEASDESKRSQLQMVQRKTLRRITTDVRGHGNRQRHA